MHALPRQAHARRLAYDALARDPAALVAGLAQSSVAVPRALLRRLGQYAAHLHAQPVSSLREAGLACLRQALPQLHQLADDRREAVRAFALFALVRLDPQADWPTRWLSPSTTHDRINWLLALEQAHRPDTLDCAQAALVDARADPAIRYVAALVLTDADAVGRAGVTVAAVASILAEFLHTHNHPLRALARRLPPWRTLDPWPRLRALGASGLTAALPELVRLVRLAPDERTGATLARRVVALALPQRTDWTKPTEPIEQVELSLAQRQLVAACLANGRLWVAQPTWRIPWEQFGLPTDRLELHQRLAQISSPGLLVPPPATPTSAMPLLEQTDTRRELDWLLARHGVKNYRKMRWFDASGVADDTLCACLRDAVNLQRLRLRESSVTDAGLAQLTRLSKLETLDLAGSPITDAGLVHVAALPALRVLRLGNCRISGAGLAHLAGKRSLRVLQLASPTITDADLQVLSQLPRLWLLDVRGCPVSAAAIAWLSAVRPRLRIC